MGVTATLPVLPARNNGALMWAFAAAMLLELLVLGGLVAWLLDSTSQPAPVAAAPMRLALTTLPPRPQVVPAPPRPKPKPTPKPQPKPKPRPVHQRARPVPRPRPQPLPAPLPAPVVAPTPPAPPPPPAPAVAASTDAMAAFASQVNTAVQAALRYPPAARMLHRYGRVRVAFDYRDRNVANLRVVVSSGFALLDSAALDAVRRADYPAPPPAEQQHLLHMTVWVAFHETGGDAFSDD